MCVCGIGHTAKNYLRLMRERQQDCLFVFALVVGVCESILGNYNISYVRVIFFLCFCVCFFVWYFGILREMAFHHHCRRTLTNAGWPDFRRHRQLRSISAAHSGT